MTTTTSPPKSTAALERELVQVCRKLDEATKLQDRRIHLFMDLRAAGVTQKRIGDVAGMSDVGVVLAIKRHRKRQDDALDKLADARGDVEVAAAREELCAFCDGPDEDAS